MKIKINIVLGLLVIILFPSCKQSDWQMLFNGENLNNWEKFINDELSQKADVDDIFSVVEEEGENLMRISGEVNAAIATKETFENYHLTMEFRWGDEVFDNRNSGLLYHSYGEFGVGLGTWMSSHEFQLMQGNVGDSYRMGNTYCEVPVIASEDGEKFIFDPQGETMPFGKNEESPIARKDKDLEKATGEWNRLDLYCYGEQSVHQVNGETVLVNYNSGKYENGEVVPLTSGYIQFQSEGGELFIRDLKIRNITELPANILP